MTSSFFRRAISASWSDCGGPDVLTLFGFLAAVLLACGVTKIGAPGFKDEDMEVGGFDDGRPGYKVLVIRPVLVLTTEGTKGPEFVADVVIGVSKEPKIEPTVTGIAAAEAVKVDWTVTGEDTEKLAWEPVIVAWEPEIQCMQYQGLFRQLAVAFFLSVHFLWKRLSHLVQVSS